MKKVTLAIAMAALVLLAGCKKDKETTGTTLTASIEQQSGNGSRTSIHPVADDQAEIHWTDGDKIVVNNGTSSQTFNLTAGAGGKTGFTYNGEYTFGDNNIAVYPETSTINGSEITVTLPAEKTVVPDISQSPMMGTFSDPDDLTFTSLCGVLGIGLKGDNINITAVEIVSNANEKLNGSFICTTNDIQPQISVAKATDEATKKMRLNCTTTLTAEAKRFYFPLPVGALAQGFTLNVYGDGEEPIFSKSPANPISIVWNQLNQMDELTVTQAPTAPAGAINGKFTINANGGQVYFAKGNLQYTKSTEKWSFMTNQYDMVETIGQNVGNDYANQNVVSLFGWATSGFHDEADTYNTNYHPYSTSNSFVHTGFNSYGYGPSSTMTDKNLVGTSAKYDWSVYNKIYAGETEIPAGTYRTLTKDEWVYLFNTRKVTVGVDEEAPYGQGNVNGVNGMILLPDNWDGSVCSSFTYGASNWSNQFSENTTTKWSEMEAAGCVFLPAAGNRNGSTAEGVGFYGRYWSSTAYAGTNNSACQMQFFPNYLSIEYASSGRQYGSSVRLVCPAE